MRRLDSVRHVNIAFRAPLMRPRVSEWLPRNSRASLLANACIQPHGFDQAFRTLVGPPKLPLRASLSQIKPRARISIDISQIRIFTATRPAWDDQRTGASGENRFTDPENNGDDDIEVVERAFAKTEKASQAAQVNLRARLSKDGASSGKNAGFREVWRLLKIARPEAKWLGSMIKFHAQHCYEIC